MERKGRREVVVSKFVLAFFPILFFRKEKGNNKSPPGIYAREFSIRTSVHICNIDSCVLPKIYTHRHL